MKGSVRKRKDEHTEWPWSCYYLAHIVGIGGLDRDRNCAGDWQRRIFWLDTHYCISFRDRHCRQCAQGGSANLLFHSYREVFLSWRGLVR